MENSRKGIAMAAGILIRSTLSGPAVRAAEQIIAQRSVGIKEIAAAPTPVNGSCGAFADALNYLCGRTCHTCLDMLYYL